MTISEAGISKLLVFLSDAYLSGGECGVMQEGVKINLVAGKKWYSVAQLDELWPRNPVS
jgi:hypothetical protein